MSISKQILIFISIVSIFLLLSCFDRFISAQTGQAVEPSAFIYLQD